MLRAKMNVAIDTEGFRIEEGAEVPIASEDKPGIPEHVVKTWLLCGLASNVDDEGAEAEAAAPREPEHTAPGALFAPPPPEKPKRRRRKAKKAEEPPPADDVPDGDGGESKSFDARAADIQ